MDFITKVLLSIIVLFAMVWFVFFHVGFQDGKNRWHICEKVYQRMKDTTSSKRYNDYKLFYDSYNCN